MNNTTECDPNDIPSVASYLQATDVYGIILICLSTLVLILVSLTFVDTLRHVLRHTSSKVKANTVCVIAIYPATCIASYLVVIVPRAQLISEALIQWIVMCGLYQLICLYVGYCGGQKQMIKNLENHKLSIKVGPCCCWPCCALVPTFDVTKRTATNLKLLVLQLPIVQGLIYIILLVLNTEEKETYETYYKYLQPFLIISILLGIWGLSMTINILKDVLDPQFLISKKFFLLQLVIISSKLQALILKSLVWTGTLPCNTPLTSTTYANLIHNSFLMVEIFFLGLWARSIYKKDIPGVTKQKPQLCFIDAFKNFNKKPEKNHNEQEACRM